tara:strand:- start:298 stop:498 length:201 start_codon:yes stop_codon:yes gene_type:complete
MSLSKIEKNGVDVYKPQCNRCVHYLKNGKCKAFPSMIPIEILTGEHDHRKPFKNDNGIRFESKSKI